MQYSLVILAAVVAIVIGVVLWRVGGWSRGDGRHDSHTLLSGISDSTEDQYHGGHYHHGGGGHSHGGFDGGHGGHH